ncbi:MAG: recombinase family protein [Candidatus Nealsonbacteria bacterium]|nr:recombinase family protein [Candidatus Nealsonbacteria bacterium]
MSSNGKLGEADVRAAVQAAPLLHGYILIEPEGQPPAEFITASATLLDQHDLEPGEVFKDLPQTSWATAFHRRPGARNLLADSRLGDYVVVPDFLRLFHDLTDCLATIDDLHGRGVGIHCCRLGITFNNSPMGDLAVQVIQGAVEQRRRAASSRNSATKDRLRKRGLVTNGSPPLGYRITGQPNRKVLHPDLKAREAMARIVELRDSQDPRLSWDRVSDQLENELAARDNRKPLRRWAGRLWGKSRCQRAYAAELELRKASSEREETR